MMATSPPAAAPAGSRRRLASAITSAALVSVPACDSNAVQEHLLPPEVSAMAYLTEDGTQHRTMHVHGVVGWWYATASSMRARKLTARRRHHARTPVAPFLLSASLNRGLLACSGAAPRCSGEATGTATARRFEGPRGMTNWKSHLFGSDLPQEQ